MKYLLTVLFAVVLFCCTKQASHQLATEEVSKRRRPITQATYTIGLTNNGDGTFSIDYGGATDVVWMFFRTGDSLFSNGNVVETNSQSFYLNPVTTLTSNISGTYYQVAVVTGSNERDANGILGADWVTSFSNVVR